MFDVKQFTWSPTELACSIQSGRIEMTTRPHTDLWARTFSGSTEDNAPVLQMKTCARQFSFTVKATASCFGPYDQYGVVMHLNADTWFKASMEHENGVRHLGSVVTNHGYSDWATVDVPVEKTTMWYRMSRNQDDFLLEYSEDGEHFSVLRMFHMWDIGEEISFGVYACSPQDSSFTAVFTDIDLQIQDGTKSAPSN